MWLLLSYEFVYQLFLYEKISNNFQTEVAMLEYQAKF